MSHSAVKYCLTPSCQTTNFHCIFLKAINGYAFESGPLLGFCNGEVATWHVSSIGAQDYIQTATFYGHHFELNERTEDFLSLYPMAGETITMNMDNVGESLQCLVCQIFISSHLFSMVLNENVCLAKGVWLLASLNSHETTKGMRVKFQDVECYRDYQYEYDDEVPKPVFNIWKPNNITTNKKEEKTKQVTQAPKEPDYDTDRYADELGLRSLKNQVNGSDVEKLDLSFLDYDAIDVPLGSMNINFNFKETTNKTGFTSKLEAMNNAHVTNWKEVENLTLNNSYMQNSNFSGNAPHIQRNIVKHIADNSSVQQTESTIFFNDEDVLLQNNSMPFTNKIVSAVVSSSDNISGLDTVNTTAQNATVLGNVTLQTMEIQEAINLTSPLQETADLSVTLQVNSTFTSKNRTMNINLSGDNYVSIGINLENSEEELSKGDMFFYSVPLSKSNIDTLNTIQKINEDEVTFLQNTTMEDNNDTSTKHLNKSALETNHYLSVQALDAEVINISNIFRNNLTTFELEVVNTTSNGSSYLNTTALLTDSANSSLENATCILLMNESMKNVTMNISRSDLPGRPKEISYSSEVVTVPVNSSLENATCILPKNELMKNATGNVSRSDPLGHTKERTGVKTLFDELTNTSFTDIHSSEIGSTNLSFPDSTIKPISSDELGGSDNSEELLIYHKENLTHAIKTSSIKLQGHNWTYDGTHSIVPQEIPDHMKTYFESEVPQTTPPPKKSKKVNLRQKPKKGQGMKTRRRKEYQPQARSGLPLSPRGFNPGMNPRGSRPSSPQPVSDEEQLINMPVVIGVPRPDFSEYDLYPGDGPDHLEANHPDVTLNEYEYVMYKDPYSSHEDLKNLNLDESSKYYGKLAGPNVKTYFLAAEEVVWDYAGYGQR